MTYQEAIKKAAAVLGITSKDGVMEVTARRCPLDFHEGEYRNAWRVEFMLSTKGKEGRRSTTIHYPFEPK